MKKSKKRKIKIKQLRKANERLTKTITYIVEKLKTEALEIMTRV